MAVGAVGFGALAVLGARNYIGERLELEKAKLQPPQETVEVVVAKHELGPGDPVAPETMAVRRLPRDLAPGGAVSPGRFDTVQGGRLLVGMRPGEPLLASAVASPESGSISSRVRPGVRAMTIAVDEVNSLSGMLQPGDRIDLLLSVRPPSVGGMSPPEVTHTVMQGVTVMATGRQSRPGPEGDALAGRPYTAITVEVDPEQAQRLVVAQRSGKLTAVLRNPQDHARVDPRKLDLNALLGSPAPLAAVSVPAPQVIVGGRGPLVESGPPAPAYPPARVAPPASQPVGATDDAARAAPQGIPPGSTTGAGSSAPAGPPGVWVPLDLPQTVPLLR